MRTPPAAWNASKIVTVVAGLASSPGRGQAGRTRIRRPRPSAAWRSGPCGRARPGGACAQSATYRSSEPMATGLPFLPAQAHPLALALLRAHPTGDAGEGVVVEQRVGGAGHVALAQELDEPRDVDPDRAAIDALGVLALEAALGLEHGELLGKPEVDLVEECDGRSASCSGIDTRSSAIRSAGPIRPVRRRGSAGRCPGWARAAVGASASAGARRRLAVGHRDRFVVIAGSVGRAVARRRECRDPARFASFERRLLERAIRREPVGEPREIDLWPSNSGPSTQA